MLRIKRSLALALVIGLLAALGAGPAAAKPKKKSPTVVSITSALLSTTEEGSAQNLVATAAGRSGAIALVKYSSLAEGVWTSVTQRVSVDGSDGVSASFPAVTGEACRLEVKLAGSKTHLPGSASLDIPCLPALTVEEPSVP